MVEILSARVILTCPGRNFVRLPKYEYRRAYLPVARLEDGTITNW